MFEIISATHEDGQDVSMDQIKADWPTLKAKNAAAMEKEPTWFAFGGVLTVQDRKYQVCPFGPANDSIEDVY